jgi:hypothetical protein
MVSRYLPIFFDFFIAVKRVSYVEILLRLWMKLYNMMGMNLLFKYNVLLWRRILDL